MDLRADIEDKISVKNEFLSSFVFNCCPGAGTKPFKIEVPLLTWWPDYSLNKI